MTLMTGAKCQGGAFAADVADPNFVEIEARLQGLTTAITDNIGFSNLMSFGAVGDTVYTTGVGTDDTVAIKAWLASGPNLLLPIGKDLGGGKYGYFKFTSTLTIPAGTCILGVNKTWAGLWSAVPATDTAIWLGPTDSVCDGVILTGFGVRGGAVAGRNMFSGWTLRNCIFDLQTRAGVDYILWLYRAAAGQAGPEGGGLENCKISFWDCGPGTPCRAGVYVRGWANGCDIDLNFNGGMGSVGKYGLYLDGTYAKANGSKVHGCMQGQVGSAVKLTGMGLLPHITDFWCEANNTGQPAVLEDIDITGHHCVRIENIACAQVKLHACYGASVRQIYGQLAADADCGPVDIGNILDQERAAVASTAELLQNGILTNYSAGPNCRSGFTSADPGNVLMNGDFKRWIGADGAAQNIWSTVAAGSYVGTKCGTGLGNTTRTRNTKFCALLQAGVGRTLAIEFAAANELANLGYAVTVSFKYKFSVAGTLYVSVVDTTAVAVALGTDAATFAYDCESGFKRVIATWYLTQAMLTNGACVQLDFPAPAAVYVSELMVQLGLGASRDFCIRRENLKGDVKLENGLLRYQGAGAPAGGDPIFGSPHQVGDIVEIPPVSGQPRGYICTVVAPSPAGTWKSFGAIA